MFDIDKSLFYAILNYIVPYAYSTDLYIHMYSCKNLNSKAFVSILIYMYMWTLYNHLIAFQVKERNE